jgi:hypothetical protein
MPIFKLIYLSLLLLVQCGGKPDGPGQCKRSCSNVYTAPPGDFKLEAISSSGKIRCATNAQSVDLSVHFWVYKEIETDAGTRKRAVSNISVGPAIAGAFAPVNQGSSYPYSVTSEDDMCTDSCGVVEFRFSPICPEPNKKSEVSIGARSGALASPGLVFDIEGSRFGEEK